MINLIAGTTFTTGVLITDAVQAPGGSIDSIPTFTRVDNQPVSAALEINSTLGALLISRMTTAERDAATFVPAGGMIIYNTSVGAFQFREDNAWISITNGSGDVVGPDVSVTNNIVTFADTTGKLIQDSGVSITQVPSLAGSTLATVNQIGELGHIAYTGDLGTVFVDSLAALQHIVNDFGPDSQVCTLFTGELPSTSTSPSALVELQSSTGALLLSRMSTAERNDLIPSDGMIVYNNSTHTFQGRENGSWIDFSNNPIPLFSYFPPTYNNQIINVAEGYNQSGFGSGMIGTNKTMNASRTSFFDSTTVNANSKGFFGSVFDGRYLYLIPTTTDTGSLGQITRYDTTADFNDTSSYTVFNTQAVNANSFGFNGGAFDGRYIYLVPNANTSPGFSGQITRYDTLSNFISNASYDFFDTAAVNANSEGFFGAVFDGRYIYFIPNSNDSGYIGQITRYDTTQDFTLSTSYAFFDTKAVNANSAGFWGGVFDGRYLYLVPNTNASGIFGQITRYDTTLSFADAASYSFFDTTSLNSNSEGFAGAVFDGRYIYYIPNGSGNLGQITRYDTTGSFSSSSSYTFFNTTAVNANSKGFCGGTFDGRYLYLAPALSTSGQVTRYDVTKPFSSASSYDFFDTEALDSNSCGFLGCQTDGKHVYFIPFSHGGGYSGLITRIEAYSGPSVPYKLRDTGVTAGAYTYSSVTVDSQGLITTIQNGTPPVLTVSGTSGEIESTGGQNPVLSLAETAVTPGTYTDATITVDSFGRITDAESGEPAFFPPTYDSQKATVLNGYNQPFGSSVLGSKNTISASTTESFNTASLNAASVGFRGSAFDGRYLYFVPYNDGSSGQVTKYDTTKSLSDSSAYDFFNTKALNSNSCGFNGAVFDGRYIYYVPYQTNLADSGQITRYDTTGSFTDAASYSFFDTKAVNASSKLFAGGWYDGMRYIYFVPNTLGVITRYDTTQSFTSAGSYTFFDSTSVNVNSKGFVGAISDGRYLYFVPNNSMASGQITRYDTSLSFTSGASYSVFDTASLNAGSGGFFGAVFDGRYIYFTPNFKSTYSGLITRYDTTQAFNSSSAYSFFNGALINVNSAGFSGAVFDGRYIYYIPNANGMGISTQVTIYDVTQPFTSSSSYQFVSLSAPNGGYWGGAFDGKYVYCIPYYGSDVFTRAGVLARFQGYSGAPVSVLSAAQALNGFTVNESLSLTGNLSVTGNSSTVGNVSITGNYYQQGITSGWSNTGIRKGQASVQTTNNTPTNILSIPITTAPNGAIFVKVSLVCTRNDAGAAAYGESAASAFYNGSSYASVNTLPSISLTNSGLFSVAAAWSVSSSNLLLNVTGITAQTINWVCSYEWSQVTTSTA